MTADLARRAVACPGWRWMRGMRVLLPQDVGTVTNTIARTAWVSWHERCPSVPVAAYDLPDLLPDLTDPATLGCLLALVREAWGDPWVHAAPIPTGDTGLGWAVWFEDDLTRRYEGATEAEALIAALESAPGGGA